MAYYNKGASAERELLHQLYGMGLAVVRAAGSGKTSLPCPDVVAAINGRILAFECKAWRAENLSISLEQMDQLTEWCEKASAQLVIAWKVPNQGWLFLNKDHLHPTGKYFTISKKNAFKKSMDITTITGVQNKLV